MFFLFTGLIIYWLILRAERALVGVGPRELEQLRAAERDAHTSSRLRLLAENPRPALAALLLARILLLVLLAVWTTAWVMRRDAWIQIARQEPWGWWYGAGLLMLAAVGLALVFQLLKWIGLRIPGEGKSLVWLRRLSGFIRFWRALFGLLIREQQAPEAEEIPANADAAAEANPIASKRDIDLLKSIVKFSDVTVKQVMQSRLKIVGVDFRTDFSELLATVRESGFSRLPVYDEDLDNVTGILYVKDLLPHLDQPAHFEWQSLIRTNVLLVPESKRASELLQEFKKKKLHLAVVVDEYGGTAGIVTMEDILEEVTGEIRDEFDEESEVRYRKIDDYCYAFEGQALLNDVCRITGLPVDTFDEGRGDADTLAGLVLELSGDIPAPGTEISWNSFVFTVVAADNRRIQQLKFTLPRS
ncbi:MAG: transporter associated domain-containing protein [Saprospiraceae bacterium]|nr:transporter associated domain-containing protein [Saprospiraceae bacterium]HNL39568.1 transporter associated domain-containing protein [Saprospiraceae bacterium]